jgi:hypothetical protein
MIILKLFKYQKEIGEIKFKDDEKFLMTCNFAQRWRDKAPKKNDFNISFENNKISRNH